MAKEHNSDFSKVAITNQIASVIASLIPALVLVDAEEGSGGEMREQYSQIRLMILHFVHQKI